MTSPLLLTERYKSGRAKVRASLIGSRVAAGFAPVGAQTRWDPFDSNTLGNYSVSFGGWAISGGKLNPGGATDGLMYVTGGANADHVIGTIIGALPTGAPMAGLISRSSGAGVGTRFLIDATGRAYVDRDGTDTPGYVTAGPVAHAGSELRIYSKGTAQSCWVDGVKVWEGTTARTEAEGGIWMRSNGGAAANMQPVRFDHLQMWAAA